MPPRASAAAVAASTSGAAKAIGLPGYSLRSLRVVYSSPSTTQLQKTILNLKQSLLWLPAQETHEPEGASAAAGAPGIPWPVPERRGRREWRVSYLKSPFKFKYAVRHYVFQNHSYSFLFVHPDKPRALLSAALGAMTDTVSMNADFDWHYGGPRPKLLPAALQHDGCPSASADAISVVVEEERLVKDMQRQRERKSLHWFHKGDPTV
ncbi:uncharacterized protein LOC34621111 [Cyclospora cayetanensis]|nr:uncharacterized protein LOC34621111 [Cyclospora cayetanensis]